MEWIVLLEILFPSLYLRKMNNFLGSFRKVIQYFPVFDTMTQYEEKWKMDKLTRTRK